jgi:hypothetical protein
MSYWRYWRRFEGGPIGICEDESTICPTIIEDFDGLPECLEAEIEPVRNWFHQLYRAFLQLCNRATLKAL